MCVRACMRVQVFQERQYMHVCRLSSENHLSPQPHISPVGTNPCSRLVCPSRDVPLTCGHVQLNMRVRAHLSVILLFKKLRFCIGHRRIAGCAQ